MSAFIHKHILLPAFESGLKRRKTLRYWRGLEQSQWLPRAELEELQHAALRRLLAHAYEHCPYYRQAWDGLCLHPKHVENASDLARWPIIDRDTIREHRMSMRSTIGGLRLISKSTGGSSGVPLTFDLDFGSHDRRTAAWHRGYSWASAGPGSKQLYLWGGSIGGKPWRSRVKDRLYQAMQRRRVMNCFDGGADLPGAFAREIERYQPDAVVAYTNPIYEVAKRLDEDGVRPRHTPKAIVVGAEKLHDFQRETIERVLGAPVFETYGSREFMLIGAECERHAGLHLTTEHLLVEILGDDGQPTPPGAEGNVVITDLYNYGMPFIRYATGDRAVAGFADCPCGRGLPLLKKVTGRRLDMLVASGGRLIPGEFFPHLVKDFPAVRRFQVVQEEPRRIRFALAAEHMPESDRARLERLVREAMGPEVEVNFENVQDVPLTKAGKLRVVHNRMPLRRVG